MIIRADILKDLSDWKNGRMGYRALIDAIDRYAESKQLHKPIVMKSLPTDKQLQAISEAIDFIGSNTDGQLSHKMGNHLMKQLRIIKTKAIKLRRLVGNVS